MKTNGSCSLFSELMCMITILVTKPFFLCISACLFGLKTAFIAVHISVDLVNTFICFHVNMFWGVVVGTVNLLLLPVRFLTAIPREKLLEQCMHEMQFELENLEWNRKEIEENLQAAIKEYRIMESELTELEEKHEKAISRIGKLEAELQDLKAENLHLKEIQGKGYWSFMGHAAESFDIPCGIPASKSSYDRGGIKFRNPRMKNNPLEQKKNPSTAQIPKSLETAEILGHERRVALSQSLFSAVLSLLVGITIFEAKEPCSCMPLVVALFTVVGISLKTVLRFFSTIKNRPASDAVALLSLNWFILGTLTYPTLPRLAQFLAPEVSGIKDPHFG